MPSVREIELEDSPYVRTSEQTPQELGWIKMVDLSTAKSGIKARENARRMDEKSFSFPVTTDARKLPDKAVVGKGKQTRAAPRPELSRKDRKINPDVAASKLKSELKKEHYCLRASVERETYLTSQIRDICAEVAEVKSAYDTFVAVYAEEKPAFDKESSNLREVLVDLSRQICALQERVENEDCVSVEERCEERQELATIHEERRDRPDGTSSSLTIKLKSVKSDLRSSLATGDTLQTRMAEILKNVAQVKSIFSTFVAVYAEEKTGTDSKSSYFKDALAELSRRISLLDRSQCDDSTCADDISQISDIFSLRSWQSDEAEGEDVKGLREMESTRKSRNDTTRPEQIASMLKKERNNKEETLKHMLNNMSVSMMQTTPRYSNEKFLGGEMSCKKDKIDAGNYKNQIHQLKKSLLKEKKKRAADAASFQKDKEVLKGTIDALENLCRRFNSVDIKDTGDGLEVINLSKALAQEKRERALLAEAFQKEKDNYEQTIADLREGCDPVMEERVKRLNEHMEEMKLSHSAQISSLMRERSDMFSMESVRVLEVVSLKKERDLYKEEVEKISREVAELKDSHETQLNSYESEMNKLKKDSAKYVEKVEDLEEEVALLDAMVNKKDAEIKSQKREHCVEVRKLSKELVGFKKSHDIQSKCRAQAPDSALFEKEKNNLKKRITALSDEKESLLSEIEKLNADLVEVKGSREECDRIAETNYAMHCKLTLIEAMAEKRAQEIDDLKAELAEAHIMASNVKSIQKEKEELEHTLATIRDEFTKKEGQMMEELDSSKKAMDEMKLMQESQHAELKKRNKELWCQNTSIEAMVQQKIDEINKLKKELQLQGDGIMSETDILKDSLNALKEVLQENEESEAAYTKRLQELSERIELLNLILNEKDEEISHLQAMLEEKNSANALEAESFQNKTKMLKATYHAKEKSLNDKMKNMEREMEKLRQLHEKELSDCKAMANGKVCEMALKDAIPINMDSEIGFIANDEEKREHKKEHSSGIHTSHEGNANLRSKISNELEAIVDILQVSAAVKGVTLEDIMSDELSDIPSLSGE